MNPLFVFVPGSLPCSSISSTTKQCRPRFSITASSDNPSHSTPPTLSPTLQSLIHRQTQRPIYFHDSPPSTSSFHPLTYSAELNKQFLTQSQLVTLQESFPLGYNPAILLSNSVESLIDSARNDVYSKYPSIDQPGNALYPEFRAKACWRDFWHFVRIVQYAVALEITDESYLNPLGLEIMNELYKEFSVPIDAMMCGVQSLKKYAMKLYSEHYTIDSDETKSGLVLIESNFDQLINALRAFE
mmetsp:Transcript_5405/g.9520  ORF Transcript_5405/g.9520 Transcript_5405/m.9520 type:complete len:243 (-) Transcript_5405:285-1013(-)